MKINNYRFKRLRFRKVENGFGLTFYCDVGFIKYAIREMIEDQYELIIYTGKDWSGVGVVMYEGSFIKCFRQARYSFKEIAMSTLEPIPNSVKNPKHDAMLDLHNKAKRSG